MIAAQWVNPEKTTLEVTIDGVTSYVTKGLDTELSSQDGDVTASIVTQWLEEGNNPLPYYKPGG